MDVLIPVDRYRVDFEVGSGSPFSELDFIVLKSIALERVQDLENLALKLYLPKRLLIESLVGLARAGRIAIGGTGAGFTATEQGMQAVINGILPAPEKIDYRRGYVLVDKVTGRICSTRDVTYATTKRLMDDGIWNHAIKLERSRHLPRLDGGQVKHLLQRDKKKEWVRWIGDPCPQQQAWLHVHIDEQQGRASGLPEVWRTALYPHIEMIVRSKLPECNLDSHEILAEKNGSEVAFAWPSSLADLHLIGTHKEHVDLLFTALREAKSQVLIASAFANASVITGELADAIKAAVKRGVRVDLLWGYSVGKTLEEQNHTLAALKALRKECEGGNSLRFNDAPTGSHAKLLVWDDNAGFKTVIGSHNWLSKRILPRNGEFSSSELSILCFHPGIGSEVCTTIAGLWSMPHSAYSSISDLWHHTAAALEHQVTTLQYSEAKIKLQNEDGNSSMLQNEMGLIYIRQIRDQEHEALMRDMILKASNRVAVTSHKVGAKAKIRIEPLPTSSPSDLASKLEILVLGGEILSEDFDAQESIQKRIELAGGKFLICPNVHAKIVVVDDAVIVSSYNFLSADPFGNASDSREVGLYIKGREIADLVWAWVMQESKRLDAKDHLDSLSV